MKLKTQIRLQVQFEKYSTGPWNHAGFKVPGTDTPARRRSFLHKSKAKSTHI